MLDSKFWKLVLTMVKDPKDLKIFDLVTFEFHKFVFFGMTLICARLWLRFLHLLASFNSFHWVFRRGRSKMKAIELQCITAESCIPNHKRQKFSIKEHSLRWIWPLWRLWKILRKLDEYIFLEDVWDKAFFTALHCCSFSIPNRTFWHDLFVKNFAFSNKSQKW